MKEIRKPAPIRKIHSNRRFSGLHEIVNQTGENDGITNRLSQRLLCEMEKNAPFVFHTQDFDLQNR
jgi:hypothetical protein